jgi:hypothetical protein
MKAIKHLATILDLLSSRSASISGRKLIRFSFFQTYSSSTSSNCSPNTNKTELISFSRYNIMANYFVRHLRTLAVTSVTVTSSYFLFHSDHSQTRNHLLSLLTVKAADYVN